MNHEQFQKLVNEYIDEGIGDAASAEMFAHLGNCTECRNLMRSSLQVRSYYRQEDPEEVSASLDRRVFATVQGMTAQRNRRIPLWATRILIPLPAAASIAILILVGGLVFWSLLFAGTAPRNDTMTSQMPPEAKQQLQALQRGVQQ